jgi:uncharacterized DUF497 family protein
MGLIFEWDRLKAAQNVAKHGITFDEASSAFGDPLSSTLPDPLHSLDEQRFILLGESDRGRIVVVVHALRGENVRIISARSATRNERIIHEEE